MKSVLPLLLLSLVPFLAGAQTAPGGAAKSTPPAATKAAPKIEGVEVARAGGGFLGVAIAGTNFKITFYDEKKQPVKADVVQALLRWDPKNKAGGFDRAVLNPTADGKALTSPKVVHPPYTFKLFITLMKETADSPDPVASETFVIDFRA